MRKKEIAEMMVRAVMSLHEEETTKIKVVSGYSDEFSVRVGTHQGSVLSSSFSFATVIDVAN